MENRIAATVQPDALAGKRRPIADLQAQKTFESVLYRFGVIGADVNEIAPGEDRLTQFNAALIATKILASHIANRN